MATSFETCAMHTMFVSHSEQTPEKCAIANLGIQFTLDLYAVSAGLIDNMAGPCIPSSAKVEYKSIEKTFEVLV